MSMMLFAESSWLLSNDLVDSVLGLMSMVYQMFSVYRFEVGDVVAFPTELPETKRKWIAK
jgi:hypothetical protein